MRDLDGDPRPSTIACSVIGEHGVPNYFGPQRFGRDGGNLDARASLGRGRSGAARARAARLRAVGGPQRLFNMVLDARVRRGDWSRLLPGEAVMLDGRRSFFPAPVIDAMLEERCNRMDVHASGPLSGRGESPATTWRARWRNRVGMREPALIALLEAQGMDHERRSLRLPVRGLSWTHEAGTLRLEFELPRGTFATAVLHELLRDAWDAEESGEE